MGSMAGIPNTILGVFAFAFALYISKDKWMPKLQNWRGKI